MCDNLMMGSNMFYVSFILLLELKNHLLNLNTNKSKTAVWKVKNHLLKLNVYRSETAVRKVTILCHPN